MLEEIFDVVLQPTLRFQVSQLDWDTLPPLESDLSLDSDFWIGRLPYSVSSESIIDAYSPAGFNFHPSRNPGYRYAFCRKVHPPNNGPEHLRWDHDGVICRALFLSCLIHPTTIAPDCSARLFLEDGELKTIVPGPVQGALTQVWIVATQWRDWLTKAEGELLRDSLPIYIQNPPDRVRRARSRIDQAFHAFYLDQRTASIVSSFESLLKVERYAATEQFALRVPALAQMVGLSIQSDEAKVLYDDRSVFVHGRQPNYTDVSDEVMERYNRFETVLRRSLLRASTDTNFCDIFATDDTVVRAFGQLTKRKKSCACV